MPKTKFQEIIFTILMVMVMVYGMIVYNISLERGGVSNAIFVLAFKELLVMGIVAFLLEVFLAGPLAKKLAFNLVTPGKDGMIVIILAISAMTVCLMCPLMSFTAAVLFQGLTPEIFAKWIQITALNFPMALFWQIFFAGPLVRWIFGRMFREKTVETA